MRPLLVDYKEFHSGAHVHFELQPAAGAVPEADDTQLLAKFKLTTKISLSEFDSLTCCSSSSSPPTSPSVSPRASSAAQAQAQAHHQDPPQ